MGGRKQREAHEARVAERAERALARAQADVYLSTRPAWLDVSPTPFCTSGTGMDTSYWRPAGFLRGRSSSIN